MPFSLQEQVAAASAGQSGPKLIFETVWDILSQVWPNSQPKSAQAAFGRHAGPRPVLGSRGGHHRWAPVARSAGRATRFQSGQVRQKTEIFAERIWEKNQIIHDNTTPKNQTTA